MTPETGGTLRLVMDIKKEELANAPTFKSKKEQEAEKQAAERARSQPGPTGGSGQPTPENELALGAEQLTARLSERNAADNRLLRDRRLGRLWHCSRRPLLVGWKLRLVTTADRSPELSGLCHLASPLQPD